MKADHKALINEEDEFHEAVVRQTSSPKHVIIAVAILLVTSVIIGGAVGVVYLTNKSGHGLAKRQVETKTQKFRISDHEETETVKVDRAGKTVELDLDLQQAKLYFDYNKMTVSGMLTVDGQRKCFIQPMTDPKFTLETFEREDNSKEALEESISVVLTDAVIPDHSILPDEAASTCQGADLAWAYTSISSEDIGEDTRMRRGVSITITIVIKL